MKVKIEYKALDLRGNLIKIKRDHECPDFKEEEFTFQGHTFLKKVNSQIMDWLDEQDKMDIIYENDLHCIIDYKVVESSIGSLKQSKKELFENLVDLLITNEQMNTDVKLTYVGMFNAIKTLKVSKQLEIVLASLGLSYMSKTEAYQNIIDIFKNNDVKKIDK